MSSDFTSLRQVEIRSRTQDAPSAAQSWIWRICASAPYFSYQKKQEDKVHPIQPLALDQASDGRSYRKPGLLSVHIIAGQRGGDYGFSGDKDPDDRLWLRVDSGTGPLQEIEIKADKNATFFVEGNPGAPKPGFAHVVASPIFPPGVEAPWPVNPSAGANDIRVPPLSLVQGAIPLLVQPDTWFKENGELKLVSLEALLPGESSARVRMRLVPDGIELRAEVPFPRSDGTPARLTGYFLLEREPGRGLVLRLLPERLDLEEQKLWRSQWNELAKTSAADDLIGFKVNLRVDAIPAFWWKVVVKGNRVAGLEREVGFPATEATVRLFGPRGGTTPQGEVTVRPKYWVLTPPKVAGALSAAALRPPSHELWKKEVYWGNPEAEIGKWASGCVLTAVVFPPSSGAGKTPVVPTTALRLASQSGVGGTLKVDLIGSPSAPEQPRHLLTHDEEKLAAALRGVHGLPEPPTSRGDPDRPMLFGFVPLDDGWLQVPIPNLPPLEAALDSDLLTSQAAPPPDVLHGFLRFGETPPTPNVVSAFPRPTEFKLECAPWVATIESAQALAVGIELSGGGKPRRGLAILMGPELSTRGLLWFSADRPDSVEALPRLGAGAGAYLDLPLETFDVEARPVLPVMLQAFEFEVTRRAKEPAEAVRRNKLELGLRLAAEEQKWKKYFPPLTVVDPWRDRWVGILKASLEVMTAAAGPTFAAEGKLPLVLWRRHSRMPLAAGMPMTRSVSSAVRPLESRDLVPWVVSPLAWPNQPLILQWNGASVFPVLGMGGAITSPPVRAAVAWPWPASARLREQTGIALTAFGVPGAEVTLPNEASTSFGSLWQGMRASLRFDLPLLDEAFATATLPPAAEVKSEGVDAPSPSAPSATALDWRCLGALWEFQERRHRLARVMHSQVRPFFAIDAEQTGEVADLVGGASWPAQFGFFQPRPEAVFPYGQARIESQSALSPDPANRVNGDAALLGFSSSRVTLRWNPPSAGDTEFEILVRGFSPASIPDGPFLIDARGTGLGEMVGSRKDGWRRPVRVRRMHGSTAAEADFELVTLAEPIDVAFSGLGQAHFKFWVKDLPVRAAAMIGSHERIDPAVWLDGRLSQSGYEWRFWPAKTDLARQIFVRGRDRFPFFGFALEPLHLETCTFATDGKIKSLELVCRLHLGPRSAAPEAGGNLVVLVLEAVGGRLVVAKDGLKKRSPFLRFSLDAQYGEKAGDQRPVDLVLREFGWDDKKGEPAFFQSELVISLFGGLRRVIGKQQPPQRPGPPSIEPPGLSLELPAQPDGAIIAKFVGPIIPATQTIAAGTGDIRLRRVELNCATETSQPLVNPVTLKCQLRVSLLPKLARNGAEEADEELGVDEDSAENSAPPAFIGESDLHGVTAEVLHQALPVKTSRLEEGQNTLAVTLETTEFSPLLELKGRASLGFLAHVGPIDPETGKGALGAGVLSAVWTASAESNTCIRLEAYCARRPAPGMDPADLDPSWTGDIEANLRIPVRNEFRWPQLHSETETTIPWPGSDPHGRSKVLFDQTKPGWVHSVVYHLDGHRLPFSQASRIAHGQDEAYGAPVMARHELRLFNAGGFDPASVPLLSFTSIENIAIGRAGAIVPRAAVPPLGGADGAKVFESDDATFVGRYRSQRPPGTGAAPGMVKLGVGRLSTVFAGCLGNAFRAEFWKEHSTHNPLMVGGGFVGFPVWSNSNALPVEYAAHLLRLPMLGFLQSSYPSKWNPAFGQRESAPFEVAWVGGGAARQLALSFRTVATPASSSLEALQGTLLSGAALPGAIGGDNAGSLESALLVEQNLRVSIDDPRPEKLADRIFHPAAAISISRLAEGAAQHLASAHLLNAISLVAGRLRRGTRSTRFAASIRAGATSLAPAERQVRSSLIVLGDDLTVGPWDRTTDSASVSIAVIAGRAATEHSSPRHALIVDRSARENLFLAIRLPSRRRAFPGGSNTSTPDEKLAFPDASRGYALDPGKPGSWMRGLEEGPTEPFRDEDQTAATYSGLAGLSRRFAMGGQASRQPIWLAEIRAPIYQPAENLTDLIAPVISWVSPGQTRPRLPTAGAMTSALEEIIPKDRKGTRLPSQWIVPAGGTHASVGDRAGIAVARVVRLETACLAGEPNKPSDFDWNFPRFGQPGQGGAWTIRTERLPRPGPLPKNHGEPGYAYLRQFPLPGVDLRNLGDPARDRRPRASLLEPLRSADLVVGPAEMLSGDAEPTGEFGPWVVKLAAAADWRGLFSDRTDGTLTLDAEITIVAGRLTLAENPQRLLRRLLLPDDGKLQSTAALTVGGQVFPFLRVHFAGSTAFAPLYPVQAPLGTMPEPGKLPPECVIRSCVRLILDPRKDTTGPTAGLPAEAMGAALRAGWSAPYTEIQLNVFPDSRRPAVGNDAATLDFSTNDATAPTPLPSGLSGPPVTLRLPLVPVVNSRGALPLPPLTLLFGDPAYDAELGTAPSSKTVRLVNPQVKAPPIVPGRGDLLFGLSADRARVNFRGSVVFMADLAFERQAKSILNPVPHGTSLDGDLLLPAQLPLRLRLAIVDQKGVRREVFVSDTTKIDPEITVQLARVYELALIKLREADGSPSSPSPGDMLELSVEELPKTPLQPTLWNADAGQRIDIEKLDATGRGVACSLRILLTAEPVVEPPAALYAALVGHAGSAQQLTTRYERLSLPLYAQSPLPWRVALCNAKTDFRVGFMRRTATFVWTLARPHDEWNRLGVALVKSDRNGQTHLPANPSELEGPRLIMANPCPHSTDWPLAPKPTVSPLKTMQWATGQLKDKFGCTRDGGTKFHAGIDIKAEVGTDCFATEDSKVEEVGYGAEVGKYVSISFKKGSQIIGVAYCHLNKTSATKGAQVKAGDKLGETGVTGNADTGNPHLHLEVQNQVWVAYPEAESRSQHGMNPNGYV